MSITIERWEMDPVNRKLEARCQWNLSRSRRRRGLVKLIRRMDSIIRGAVLINKLCLIIIVWRFSSQTSNRIAQTNNEKTTKQKREALLKTQVKATPNTNNKTTNSNNNTSRVMKSVDQLPLPKTHPKPPLAPPPLKTTEVPIITTTRS